MATWVWVVIAIAVVVVVALAVMGARKRSSAALRDRFGPEYDRTVESSGDPRAAEAELRARERRRAGIDVKPLPEDTRLRFAGEWRELQERFVDEPEEAAGAADILITRVMEARGYPMKDFDSQVELVSVDHPDTVENYRFAHGVQQRAQTQQASTEELREALLRYRSLFDDLLRPEGDGAAVPAAGEAQLASSANGQRAAAASPGQPTADRVDGQAGAVDGGSDDAAPLAPGTEYDDHRTGRRDV